MTLRTFICLTFISVVAHSQEQLTAPFINPGGTTSKEFYKGQVIIAVSGTGESYAQQLNDAFYIFTDNFHNPVTPHYSSSFYHLLINGGHPKLQNYNAEHNYTIIFDAGNLPIQLNFKVADINFSDNSGQYNITIKGETPGKNSKIYPAADTLQTIGQEFWVDIHIGDSTQPVTNLFGVTTDLVYATQYLDVVESAAGAFLGSDVIFFPHNDDAAGRITLAISRKGGNGGTSGYGTVARVKFISVANTPDCTPVRFTLDSLKAIDPDGNPIALTPGSLQVTIRPPLDFAIHAVPETLCVIAGKTDSFKISLSANCAFDTVAVLAADSPAEAVASLNFNPTAIDTSDTSTATVITKPSAKPGDYKIVVSATAKGLVRRDTVTLCIKPPPDFTLSIEPDTLCVFAGDSATYQVHLVSNESFQERVNLSARVQPSGPTPQLNPASLSGTATGNLIVRTDRNAAPGYYTIIVTGTGGDSTRADTVKLCVKIPPDFTLRVEPDTLCVVAGDSATYQVHLVSNESFQEKVNLSARAQPSGPTPVLIPTSLSGTATGSLIVRTNRNAAPGYYTIIVIGTGGDSTRADTVRLCVKTPSDFQLVINPKQATICAGDTARYLVTITSINNFAEKVNLSLSGFEHFTWATYGFSPRSIAVGQASTLFIIASTQAPAGSYPFEVSGVSDTLMRHLPATLVIQERQFCAPQDVWPNPFTPNNDGYNDFVTFDFPVNKAQLSVEIYNGRGRKVADLKGENRWYGKSDAGEDLHPGLYLYLVKIDGAIKARGTITLAR